MTVLFPLWLIRYSAAASVMVNASSIDVAHPYIKVDILISGMGNLECSCFIKILIELSCVLND